MDFLIVGNGMFGAAIARHLAPHATVTVVGSGARADGSGAYGAHHDEGRIIGDLSRDVVWSELNRRARDGLAELDPALITPCGALTATTSGGPDYLTVAARIPIRSLDPVDGWDTFAPSEPPVCTSMPAAWAGPAAALMIQQS